MSQLAAMVRAKYPGAYDDLDDDSLDRMVRQKYPGAYDDIPAKPETKDEAALRLANSRFTVNPDLDAWKRRGGAFVDEGVSMLKGMGSLGLDAAKSALTLEGQVGFLPRMAKTAYEGMVDSSAEAINRQPTPERKGLAALPFVGPAIMNVVSDYEEGKGPEAEGRMLANLAALAIPGSKAGRGATGAAIRLADGKVLKPITKGLKPLVKRGAEMGVEMAPEAIGAVAGGALGGPTGAAAGALSGKALKDAYRAVKDNAAAPKAAPSAPIPKPKASAEQIRAAVEAGPRGNAAKKLMRDAKEAKAAKAAEAQAKKEAGKAKFPEARDTGSMFNAKTGEPVKMTPEQAKAAVDELPWNKANAKAAEKTPAQAKFDKAKSDRLMKQVDEAISPKAAFEILKKHGIEGKKIPTSDARAIVDAVWMKKDPTYQSIEQWMDARKEKWNKMRTSSRKKGTE